MRGGRLVMSPREGTANSWATGRLFKLLDAAAEQVGIPVYTSVNMMFTKQTWIEPDLAVLRNHVDDEVWVPAEEILMPVELISRGSRRRDRIDKPRLCAAAGVPYFLLVEIHRGEVAVELHKLVDGSYVEAARATGGERFVTPEPFPLNFDPAELLAGRATR
ncbi:Uma2 family endonuclease [Tsukamurella sp. PLM1]|uniref:Uma2 family endonuclease n=1 Tax=Tsukamurella sp. PLM1 TaxID=2929795 RepID=UPI0021110983|nr:Uma2 family endonuclease [Tsukamurella sp. PLM1]